MIERKLLSELLNSLKEVPAVCLIGPRQVGKTTLAMAVPGFKEAVYLDLESERDKARLSDPESYLERHLDRLVILDEVHRAPGLFPVLRGLIDRARREGTANGRYLFLGSAALDLLRQSGESLAGRIRFLELAPFSVIESTGRSTDALWLRGGFPDSLLAMDDAGSLRWRLDFIRTYLERDIPQFGPRIAAETLRRFWTMLAHRQGSPFNAAELARSIGIDMKSVARYLDLLVDLLLVRRLPPWHGNTGKRLVKAPRIYLRDSGILHALLSIPDIDGLLSHPVVGASWEGFAVENILSNVPMGVSGYYYRTGGGAEVDLLLEFPGGIRWAIEVKRTMKPRPERGFHAACADLSPERRFIVYPGEERFPITADSEAVPVSELVREISKEI